MKRAGHNNTGLLGMLKREAYRSVDMLSQIAPGCINRWTGAPRKSLLTEVHAIYLNIVNKMADE